MDHVKPVLLRGSTCAYAIAAVVFVSVLLFHECFNTFFFAEDFPLVYKAKNEFNLYSAFVAKFFSPVFYRPLTTSLFYRLGYLLFDINPQGYHIMVFALFIINSFLVYLLAFRVTDSEDISFVATIFYATRSAFSLQLAWIAAGFQEGGMACFVFLSIFLYTAYYKNKSLYCYWSSFFCFVLCVISKETAMFLPLLILLFEFYKRKPCLGNIKVILIRFSPFGIVLAVFLLRLLLIRNNFMGGMYRFDFSFGRIYQSGKYGRIFLV